MERQADMRRRWLVALLIGLSSVAGALCAQQAGQPATHVADQDQLYTPAQLRADFEHMYRGLQSAHIDLYAFTSKQALDRRYRELSAQLNQPMTLLQANTQFELFAADVHMGHTRIDSPASDWRTYRAGGGKGFPLEIRVVDGHVYVAGNLSGVEAIKPGDELASIDGQDMQHWLKRTERHVSAETGYMADSLMEYDFAIYVWIELGAVDGFDVVIHRDGSNPQSVRVPARSHAQMEAFRAQQPPSLDLETPLRTARMLDDRVAYLRPGPFYNVEAKTEAESWDVSAFQQFIDHSFEGFLDAHADSVIIDLRGNPGGDNLFSDVMVSWFATRPFRFASQFKIKVSPESIAANADRIAHDAAAAGPISRKFAQIYARSKPGDIVDFDIPLAYPREGRRFTGKVYVLIDRHSYSNAVAVAALVQDYKFGLVLGEATADMATTYGAMEQFKLPHTRLSVGYPKARIVRPNGDLEAKGVTPDTPIRIPIIQTPADEVLRQAQALARGNR
jgi:C-terminal processing protease CtpA/Prc